MDPNAPPSGATNAVLVKSEEMPKDAQKVEELDFNNFKGRPITAEDLFLGMKNMGFQASSMCEAVRIIDDMVRNTIPVLPIETDALTLLATACMARCRNG